MSIVLLALAMFILVTYYLSIEEASIVMFEDSSRIELKNMHNAIDNYEVCFSNVSLCNHFKNIYGGKFKFNCSEIGENTPFNYSINMKSKNLDFSGNLTQELTCPVCGNGIQEKGETCDTTLTSTCVAPSDNYWTDCVGTRWTDINNKCKNDCSSIQIILNSTCGL